MTLLLIVVYSLHMTHTYINIFYNAIHVINLENTDKVTGDLLAIACMERHIHRIAAPVMFVAASRCPNIFMK